MKRAIFLLTAITLIVLSTMLSANPADLTEEHQITFEEESFNERTEYFVDFEGPNETKTSYAAGNVTLSGKDWLLDNVLIGTHDNDRKFGDRSARFRHQPASPGMMAMLEDKVNGLGTLSFYYARSNFANDGSPEAPVIVVEYSVDQGDDWEQIGDEISLEGVDELTYYSSTVNVEGNVRIRFRSISGTDGRRFNIDDILLTDYGDEETVAMPTFSPSGGSYFDEVSVTISTTTPDATIYYTTDESEPDEDSNVFTDPIDVTESMTIKARAYAPGLNPSLISTANYTIIEPVMVPDVATLRSSPQDDTIYQLANEAVLTYQQSFRNQKFIQDDTAGILIDDNSAIITTDYDIYDGITGIRGTLNTFGNMLQFTPVQDPGEATSHNNQIYVPTITMSEYIDDFFDHQGRVIQLNNVTFPDADGTDQFANGQVYSLSDGTLSIDFRTTFYDVDYIGEIIPEETMNLRGIPNSRSDGDYFTSRNQDDFLPASGDIDISILPTFADFGSIMVDEHSEPVTFTITNNGIDDVTIVDLFLDGDDTDDFILSGTDQYPYDIEAGGEIDFTVTFAPVTAGSKEAFINIEVTDDVSTLFFEVHLSGNGFYFYQPENVTVEIVNWHDVEISWEMPQNVRGRTNRELLGFDVYRNDNLITPETPLPPSASEYVDTEVPAGIHEYYVVALYPEGSAASEIAEISIEQQVGLVEMTPQPGDFNEPVTVTLSVPEGDGEEVIYYTLDGEEPTDGNSLLYESPFQLTETTTVKARAYKFGAVTGEVAVGEYIITVSADDGTTVPLVTGLRQNHPNPFNPDTTIGFTLGEPDRVTITIYNIKGETVQTLIDEEMAAGDYQIIWSGLNEQGRKMPSGVYFYRLSTSGHDMIRKMVMIK